MDAAHGPNSSPFSVAVDTDLRGDPSFEVDIPAPQVIDRFHALYYQAAKSGGTWASTFWNGVRVLKCPLDLWIYQEILFEVQPELIIECGTADGGSTLFLAHVCDLIGRGEIISIDVRTSPRRRRHPRISYWLGSSIEDWMVEAVRRKAADRSPVLVLLDSNHRAEHVLQELRRYAPLVTPGSYVIVEDTNVNGNPICADHGPGPMEAVQVFLQEEPSFYVDNEREKFYLTFNPSGYLRKQIPGPTHADQNKAALGASLLALCEEQPSAKRQAPSAPGSALGAWWARAALGPRLRSRLRALALAAMDQDSTPLTENDPSGPPSRVRLFSAAFSTVSTLRRGLSCSPRWRRGPRRPA